MTIRSILIPGFFRCLVVGYFILWVGQVPAAAQDYVLGPRDVLKITVYEHSDLETRARVGDDGRIAFPLLGEIQVSGLTVQQLEQKITRSLGNGYIIKPHVAVFVEEFRVVVYVAGEVERPGSYPFIEGMTAIKAISLAGGMTDRAANTHLNVRRKTVAGLEESVPIDINDVLQPNDVLQVPKKRWIYVTGEVRQPGPLPFDEDITIMKAVAMAGGFTDKAAPGRAKIIRKQSDGKETTVQVRPEDTLQPEDILLIPESYF